MCGRFTLTLEASEIQLELGIGDVPENWHPRYNIAPSQDIAIIKNTEASKISWARWGLVPSWAKDIKMGQRLINARGETIQEKPSYRNAFKSRRCVVLADGFYEWKKGVKNQKSQPFYFYLPGKKLFGLAGLWETWQSKSDETVLQTCTIITCEANELVSKVHERMPVIFTKEQIWKWLDEKDPALLQNLLIPYSSDEMMTFPVGSMVNNPSYDLVNCIQPIEA